MSVTDIPQTGLVPATLAESMDGDSLGGLVSLDSITHFVWRRHEIFWSFSKRCATSFLQFLWAATVSTRHFILRFHLCGSS